MKTIPATEAKNRLGAILDAAQREPIVIRRQDRDIAVVLSMADYERLRSANVAALLELRDERIAPTTFHPKDAGFALGSFREMAGFPKEQPEKEVELITRLIKNEVQGGPKDWMLLNAAMLLYAAGKGPSIAACVPLAKQALESGAAVRKLAALRGTGAVARDRVGQSGAVA